MIYRRFPEENVISIPPEAVGDKTSLSLAPMVAACGAKVAKMSGRGLGHTGGTLDKVESVNGFQVMRTQEQFISQVNDIGLALIGQTATLVPADPKAVCFARCDGHRQLDSSGLHPASCQRSWQPALIRFFWM